MLRTLIIAAAALLPLDAKASPLNCLADNIYREARGEPRTGKEMVAQVTLNRAQRNPRRLCSEIAKPYQFSWVNHPQRGGFEPKAFQECRQVAAAVLRNLRRDPTRGATHYHAATMAQPPRWANNPRMERVGKFGQHLAYRDIGRAPYFE